MNFTVSQALILLGLNLLRQFIYLCLGFYFYLSSHTVTLVLFNNCPKNGEIWWVNIWQVVLLLSLTECFELSLYIAKWPSSFQFPPTTLTSWAAIHQSYLCINEWKPKGRKFAFWRADLKVLVAFAQGQVPLRAPGSIILRSWLKVQPVYIILQIISKSFWILGQPFMELPLRSMISHG